MNYAFYVDLGDLTYETWYGMYTVPEALERVQVGGDQSMLQKVVRIVL